MQSWVRKKRDNLDHENYEAGEKCIVLFNLNTKIWDKKYKIKVEDRQDELLCFFTAVLSAIKAVVQEMI